MFFQNCLIYSNMRCLNGRVLFSVTLTVNDAVFTDYIMQWCLVLNLRQTAMETDEFALPVRHGRGRKERVKKI